MNLGIRVSEQAWPEIENAIENNAIAILPIAASCKEHGKHLPMATDYIQAEWLVSKLIKQINVVVWPCVSYGYYPAFIDYPGSCSLKKTNFENIVLDILHNIASSGAKRIFILNTGISTIQPLENVLQSFDTDINIQLVNVYDGKHFRVAEEKVKQQERGSHADEIETSIMLAIAPNKVKMSLADSWTDEKQPGPLNRTRQDQPNFSPSGVYGDAKIATIEKGEILIAAMLKDILHSLKD